MTYFPSVRLSCSLKTNYLLQLIENISKNIRPSKRTELESSRVHFQVYDFEDQMVSLKATANSEYRVNYSFEETRRREEN